MKNNYFILDLCNRLLYGPYKNLKKLNNDKKIVEELSNFLVEEGTNVLIIMEGDIEYYHGLLNLKSSNINELKERYLRICHILNLKQEAALMTKLMK